MRGYHAHNKIMMIVRKDRLCLNELYFDKLKLKLWSTMAIIIQTYVRKWLLLTAKSRAKKWKNN